MRAATRHGTRQPPPGARRFAATLITALLCLPALLEPPDGALHAQQQAGAPREIISGVLNPAATITGTVTDSSGHPVAEARLLVDRINPADAGTYAARSGTYHQWRSAYGRDHQTIAESDGTFRLDGLDRQASYLVTVEAQGFVRYSVELPGTGTPGAHEALDIVLSRGHRTWGRVVDTDERPVPEASIAMVPAMRDARGGLYVSRDANLTATSDAEGVFEFPAVGAGSYQLTVDHAEFTGRAPMSIAIPVGEGDVETGVFTLTPGKQIEGLVFGPDRRPVAGARVSAFDDRPVPGPVEAGSRDATTDDQGRFRIGGLGELPVQVAVEADGFAPYSLKAVEPGGELLEIELGRGATLTGRVVDAVGDAVSGAFVTIYSFDPDVWRSSLSPAMAETDADGRFRLDLLRSGTWSASAFAREGGASRAESGPIRLEEGVVREIELVLPTADAEVTGIVTNHDGEPVANAEITIMGSRETAGASPQRSAPSWQAEADQRGRFEHRRLPAGAATIIASHPEYRVIQRGIRLESGSNEISLTLQPGLEITGTLRSEDGLPVAFAEIDAELQPAPGQDPFSDDLVWRRGGAHQSAHATSDRNGDYRLAGLDTGVYILRAWADGYGAGGPGHRVQVEGGSLAGVDLVLPAEAAIVVRIAGEPVSGLDVGVQQGYEDYRTATQDPSGAFRIDGLGPGDWTVTAHDFGGRRAEQIVTLAPGDEAAVELSFEEGLHLTGWMTVAGQPPGGGNVALVSGNIYPRWTDLDRDGRFELLGVQPGVYNLLIRVPGAAGVNAGTVYQRQVELREDEELRLDLESPAVLTGVVTDSEGRPLAGAFLLTVQTGTDAIGQSAVLSGQGMAGTTLTDADGRFELRSAPGSYDLQIVREGFETLIVPVELASAERRQGLIFELRSRKAENGRS